jgi:hypothetical protein
MSIRNVTGSVVRGDDFFDRVSVISSFWNDLETDNLLVLAPRRVGKTSILRKMEADARDQGYSAIFVDVSDCADELAFVRRLFTAVHETSIGERFWESVKSSWLGKTVSRVNKVGGAGFSLEFRTDASEWARLGEELASALEKLDGRWLIEVDELPVFILKLLGAPPNHQTARIREFLYWLRRLRIKFPALRWMLAGSIGLDTVTARMNVSDAINDLRIVTVGAFEPDIADAFLLELAAAYNVTLTPAVRKAIMKRVGWLAPYYLQLVFKQVRERSRHPKPSDVKEAVEALLQPVYRTHFDYWRQRLEQELAQPDSAYAITLLSACAKDASGASTATLSQHLVVAISDANERRQKLQYLLDVLQGDGYLVEHAHRFRFRFPLLREYWLKRMGPMETA